MPARLTPQTANLSRRTHSPLTTHAPVAQFFESSNDVSFFAVQRPVGSADTPSCLSISLSGLQRSGQAPWKRMEHAYRGHKLCKKELWDLRMLYNSACGSVRICWAVGPNQNREPSRRARRETNLRGQNRGTGVTGVYKLVVVLLLLVPSRSSNVLQQDQDTRNTPTGVALRPSACAHWLAKLHRLVT